MYLSLNILNALFGFLLLSSVKYFADLESLEKLLLVQISGIGIIGVFVAIISDIFLKMQRRMRDFNASFFTIVLFYIVLGYGLFNFYVTEYVIILYYLLSTAMRAALHLLIYSNNQKLWLFLNIMDRFIVTLLLVIIMNGLIDYSYFHGLMVAICFLHLLGALFLTYGVFSNLQLRCLNDITSIIHKDILLLAGAIFASSMWLPLTRYVSIVASEEAASFDLAIVFQSLSIALLLGSAAATKIAHNQKNSVSFIFKTMIFLIIALLIVLLISLLAQIVLGGMSNFDNPIIFTIQKVLFSINKNWEIMFAVLLSPLIMQFAVRRGNFLLIIITSLGEFILLFIFMKLFGFTDYIFYVHVLKLIFILYSSLHLNEDY